MRLNICIAWGWHICRRLFGLEWIGSPTPLFIEEFLSLIVLLLFVLLFRALDRLIHRVHLFHLLSVRFAVRGRTGSKLIDKVGCFLYIRKNVNNLIFSLLDLGRVPLPDLELVRHLKVEILLSQLLTSSPAGAFLNTSNFLRSSCSGKILALWPGGGDSRTFTELVGLLGLLDDRGDALIDLLDPLALVLDLLEALGDFFGHAPDENQPIVRRRDQVLHVVREAHGRRDLPRLGPAQRRARCRLVDSYSL